MSALTNFDSNAVVNAAGKVVVLMGGHSAEREISLNSGRAIVAALRRLGVDADGLSWDDELVPPLLATLADRVFIALHGRGGEDGSVQGLLDNLRIPYTGSKVLGCALSMDKIRSKQVWQSANLPTPDYQLVNPGDSAASLKREMRVPLMVKPSREGSSFGVSRVNAIEQLPAALDLAFEFDDEVLIETCVVGGEYTLGIVDGLALPMIKLETPHEFYDFDAKYVVDTTRYLCPCGLPEVTINRCEEIGLKAFSALGASGWGRVDFMLDENNEPWLIELNTVPGMTDHSLVPMAAAAQGIEFDELVLRILATSMEAAN